MLKEAIYHRPKNNFAYAYDKDTLHIVLQTKKGDMQSVSLIYGDPCRWENAGWMSDTLAMKKSGTTALFEYWSAEIKPGFTRLRSGSACSDETASVTYTEKGS